MGPSNEDRSNVYIVDPSNTDTVPLKLKDDGDGL